MKKVRVLVTGATGMIGKYMVQKLSKEIEYEEIVCTTYSSSVSSIDSTLFFRSPKIKLVPYIKELGSKESKYDEIWHFGTYGQPGRFRENWQGMVKANSHDIGVLVDKLKETGHFFYASSSEIYGSVQNASENDNMRYMPKGERGIYTESKLLGELIIESLLGKERSTVLRICLTYAPAFRLDDRRVLYELIMKAIVDGVVALIDDGSAVRQYLYIDDAVDMMRKIRDRRKTEASTHSIFNVSNPCFSTIYEVATIVAKYFGVGVKCGKGKSFLGALKSTEVLPNAYNELFGPRKYTELRDGIYKVCEFAEKHYTHN